MDWIGLDYFYRMIRHGLAFDFDFELDLYIDQLFHSTGLVVARCAIGLEYIFLVPDSELKNC